MQKYESNSSSQISTNFGCNRIEHLILFFQLLNIFINTPS